jgi:hypothetical protein
MNNNYIENTCLLCKTTCQIYKYSSSSEYLCNICGYYAVDDNISAKTNNILSSMYYYLQHKSNKTKRKNSHIILTYFYSRVRARNNRQQRRLLFSLGKQNRVCGDNAINNSSIDIISHEGLLSNYLLTSFRAILFLIYLPFRDLCFLTKKFFKSYPASVDNYCFVSVYQIAYLAILKKDLLVLEFTEPDEQWLDFIFENRAGIYSGKTYDIIYGAVANDTIYRVLTAYEEGIIPKEECIRQLKVRKLYNQMTFASEKALAYLKFTSQIELSVRRD